MIVGLRPEHLVVCAPGDPGAIPLGVAVIERTGSTSYIVTDTDPDLTISASGRVEPDGAGHLGADRAPKRPPFRSAERQPRSV